MIIAKIEGGLGNQMFQYAFARKLAMQHGVELKLDITSFETEHDPNLFTNRDFELSIFNTEFKIASVAEIEKFNKSKFLKLLDYISLFTPFKSSNFYLREPHFHFFANAKNTPANAYVNGFWHSEKYFSDANDAIRSDFKMKAPLSNAVQTLAEQLKNNKSVSIHVRRGDYISIEKNKQIYASCDAAYYSAAIAHIAKEIQDPEFYIFSDDPTWAFEHLKSDWPMCFVNRNIETKNYEDLFLMSCCKHNIIANSSFSWWAAWLNSNTDKLIIAPAKWYADDSKNTTDLIPASWIKL